MSNTSKEDYTTFMSARLVHHPVFLRFDSDDDEGSERDAYTSTDLMLGLDLQSYCTRPF